MQRRGSARPSEVHRSSGQWPEAPPGFHLYPRSSAGRLRRHTGLLVGPEPQPPLASRCPILRQDSPRGQRDPEACSGQTQRSAEAVTRAPAVGSAVRSTSNGPRTEGSRAPGPWPVASPHRRPAPPPTNGIPTWTLAHTGRCGGQPAAAPGSPKRPGAWPRLRLGTAPTGGGRPGTGQPHVCPCSPGPGPFPAERDRANAPHCCSSLPSIGPDPGVDTSRSLSSAP